MNRVKKYIDELLQDSSSLNEFDEKLIIRFKQDEIFFQTVLQDIFKEKLIKVIEDKFGFQNIKDRDKIDLFLPIESRKIDLKEIEIESNLIMPRPIMSTKSFILLCLLVLIPLVIIIIVAFYDPAIFAVIFEIITRGGFVILFILVIAVHFISPNLLSSNNLPRVNTFEDLICEVVKINEHFYRINNFQLIIDELNKKYFSHDVSKRKN